MYQVRFNVGALDFCITRVTEEYQALHKQVSLPLWSSRAIAYLVPPSSAQERVQELHSLLHAQISQQALWRHTAARGTKSVQCHGVELVVTTCTCAETRGIPGPILSGHRQERCHLHAPYLTGVHQTPRACLRWSRLLLDFITTSYHWTECRTELYGIGRP
jgi:hypothetical protein